MPRDPAFPGTLNDAEKWPRFIYWDSARSCLWVSREMTSSCEQVRAAGLSTRPPGLDRQPVASLLALQLGLAQPQGGHRLPQVTYHPTT